MRNILVGFVSFALASSIAADAQNIPSMAATRLQVAGKWTVEYADWQCVLHRDYLVNSKPAHFALTLEPLTPTAWLRIAIEGGGVNRDDGEDAVMIADDQRRPGSFHYNIFGAKKQLIREYMLDLRNLRIGDVENRLRLWTAKHGDIDVPVDGFQNAWKATKACMADLYTGFGIKEADVNAMTTEPQGDVLEFVSAPRGVASMTYAFLYWVNADGKIDECHLLRPSGNKAFDQSFCTDLEKAKLKPARDATGNPIRVPRFLDVMVIIETTDVIVGGSRYQQ